MWTLTSALIQAVGLASSCILLLSQTKLAAASCQTGVVAETALPSLMTTMDYQHSSFARSYLVFYQMNLMYAGLQSYYFNDFGSLELVGETSLDQEGYAVGIDPRKYVAQGNGKALVLSLDKITGNLTTLGFTTTVSDFTLVANITTAFGIDTSATRYDAGHFKHNSAADEFIFLNFEIPDASDPSSGIVPFLLKGDGMNGLERVPSDVTITDFMEYRFCNFDVDVSGLVLILCPRIYDDPLTALVWNSMEPSAVLTVLSSIPTDTFGITDDIFAPVYSHGMVTFGPLKFMLLATSLFTKYRNLFASYTEDGGQTWTNASHIGVFNITEDFGNIVYEVGVGYFNQWIITILDTSETTFVQKAIVGPLNVPKLSAAQWTVAASQLVDLGKGQKEARVTNINSASTLIKLHTNADATQITYSIVDAGTLGSCDGGGVTASQPSNAPSISSKSPSPSSSSPTFRVGAFSQILAASLMLAILCF